MNTAAIRTTAPLSFFPYNMASDTLFSVNAGVPAIDALETVSSFLDVARDAARKCGASSNDNSAYAADNLITMAKALVDSVLAGSMGAQHTPDEYLLANVFERLWSLHVNGVLVVADRACKIEQDDANAFLNWVGQQVKGGAQ